ncbi:unnamed protein product [Polarella glacialis]|uniref:AB hydrolase-1 domain-containing protein n=1 Tax=Polarella glacialis TaxID=89957 RepID=A0A813ETV7_POLGL|nr:unnamed protein product [Polarella glacialis]
MGLRLCFGRVEASLLYHPRRYKDQELLPDSVWQLGAQLYASEKLSYSVRNWRGSSFPQSALLLKPQSGDVDVLWVLFGGNAMLATDWLPFCTRLLTARGASPKLPGVAFLLVDYPGYGSNLGEPTPGSILKGSCEAIRAALRQIKGSTVGSPEIHLLGHSLGAAAAAQLAAAGRSQGIPAARLILSAPFIDIPQMAMQLLGSLPPPKSCLPEQLQPLGSWLGQTLWRLLPVFLSWTLPHVWSNTHSVRKAAKDGWRVAIVHGARDEIVPFFMGRTLWQEADAAGSEDSPAVFVEVPQAGHNDVVLAALPEYARLMGLAT